MVTLEVIVLESGDIYSLLIPKGLSYSMVNLIAEGLLFENDWVNGTDYQWNINNG